MFIFVLLGIVTSIFQLVLLREFSFSIAKNELAFIVAAGFWIIFCAIGSIIKVTRKFHGMAMPVLASLCFFASMSGIHLSKGLAGIKYYEIPGLGFILISGILLIGPNALISGNIFKWLVEEHLEEKTIQNNSFARFFAFEAIGFFIGGLIFTAYLNNYTNPLLFSPLPNLLILGRKKGIRKAVTAILIIVFSLSSFKTFKLILRKEFGNANIIANLGSRYGPVFLVRKDKVETVFSAGSLLASSEDKSGVEEFIHISLSAAETLKKKDVLFIGPALSGQIEEILKYSPESIDCLQLNPAITKLSKDRLPYSNKENVSFITDDPVRYLQNINKLYDAVLISMPAPSSLSLNRYFTKEFFQLIKLKIKPKGIFSFFIPSKREILSPQFARFNSSIINAVDRVFSNRILIPSDSMIIIASADRVITDSQLLKNFTRAEVNTAFFTYYHFKDLLNPSMRRYTEGMLDKMIAPNTYLNPTGFLNYLILEQMKFYPKLRIELTSIKRNIFIFLIFMALAIAVTRILSKQAFCLLNIGAIGFTSISLSSIIYALFQIYCGALFWKLGLLICLFMIGLSLGVLLINRLHNQRSQIISISYLGWMSVALMILFSLGKINSAPFKEEIFYLFSFICGALTGGSYPILAGNLKRNEFNKKTITTVIYSADLTGAFLGTLSCGILLIPFLGIPASLAVILILNAIFAFGNLKN